jgi:MFS family permease
MAIWHPWTVKGFNRDFWILSLGWFIAALGFAISIPFLALYFSSELGLTKSQIGLFFVGIAVVRAASQIIGGEISDRVGRYGLILHSQSVRSVSFVFLGMAIGFKWGFWPVAILFGINAIFGSLFMPAVNALVSDMLPPEKRLHGYAVARSASNLGWAVGPAIGGFMATSSYASLFYISALLSLGSLIVFWLYFTPPAVTANQDRFKFADLLAVKDDRNLATHVGLTLVLYLVVAQLIAPFSLYAVEMAGLSEARLGLLFTLNGLFVVLFQFPITRLLSRLSYTTQIGAGAALYFVGYGIVGFMGSFWGLAVAIVIVTLGEVTMSPPGLTLTSRLAPEGRTGRYMGIRGFFETVGWSLGPMYGGFFLDTLGDRPVAAWLAISSLALVAAAGYFVFGRYLPKRFNGGE